MEYEIHTTSQFDRWHKGIKDATVLYKLEARLSRVADGNFGDAKTIAANLYELRFFFGGGIRIYYTVRNSNIVILLCGGNKGSQKSDIEKAKKLITEIK